MTADAMTADTAMATDPAATGEPIAVVGIGCRFPGGATNPARFWDLLVRGGDAVVPVPASRGGAAGRDGRAARRAGLLDAVDEMDADFMGVSPREARLLDPQHRLVLEVAWEALEDAAIAPYGLAGTRTGVFVGISWQDYLRAVTDRATGPYDPYTLTGNLTSVAAGRVAHLLGLRGPAMAVDTASSSSLVAVHLACQSLRTGETSLALAGGVNLLLSESTTQAVASLRTLSPNARCRAFDAEADGYVRGEGAGVVVLKRLADARQDGDDIRAVIRGSAVNHDGGATGLTAPDPDAQRELIRDALRSAGLAPEDIGYIEAHGTGTPLGDRVEVAALAQALGPARPGLPRVALASVKTNLGHLETAAGIAGLTKAVLALQHEVIPRHLHLKTVSPNVGLDEERFVIPTGNLPWPSAEAPRRAGVSSFGLAGTNAHVVLESAPAAEPAAQDAGAPEPEATGYLLPLSARGPQALAQLAGRYARHLDTHPGLPLGDVCRTAGEGRSHFGHRLAILARTTEEARFRLRAAAAGRVPDDSFRSAHADGTTPSVAVLFGGELSGELSRELSGEPGGELSGGPGFPAEQRQLCRSLPAYRAALAECAELLGPLPGARALLASVLARDPHPQAVEPALLNRAEDAQPVLFALQWARWALWRSWGVKPAVLLGFGVGELVAACAAGALTLETGLRLAAERGRLAGQLPYDASALTVSGEVRLVDEASEGIDAASDMAADVQPGPERVPLISSVTGEPVAGTALDAGYWRRHLRAPVRFEAAAGSLDRFAVTALLEVGPRPRLLEPAARWVADPAGLLLLPLPAGSGDEDGLALMLRGLGELYAAGADIDWRGVAGAGARRRSGLPGYPFQRSRHWYEPAGAVPAVPEPVALKTNSRSERPEPVAVVPPDPVAVVPPDHAPPEIVATEPGAGRVGAIDEPTPVAAHTPDAGVGRAMLDLVRGEVASALGHPSKDAVDPGLTFKDLGVDSLMAVDLSESLSSALGRRLSPTLVFDQPTPAALAARLLAERDRSAPASPAARTEPAPRDTAGREAAPDAPVPAAPDAAAAAAPATGAPIGPAAAFDPPTPTSTATPPGTPATAPADPASAPLGTVVLDELQGASADEVFAFIDREIGLPAS